MQCALQARCVRRGNVAETEGFEPSIPLQYAAFLATAVLVAGLTVAPVIARDPDVQKGRAIAERLCARCHDITAAGPSPLALAPPFRLLPKKYPVEHLAEALAEGIVTGHPAMPQFKFSSDGDRRAAQLHRQPGATGQQPSASSSARLRRDAMRIATFNLESLDLPPRAAMPLEARARSVAACARAPAGRHPVPAGDQRPARSRPTRPRPCGARSAARRHGAMPASRGLQRPGPSGHGAADVHNLVTLSRYPIRAHRQVAARLCRPAAASAHHGRCRGLQSAEPVQFDRPLLLTRHRFCRAGTASQ